jgi:Glycosyl hydrolases family 2, sugar binding domain/Glycosyl hydrolases family 2, TIM barrel domain
VISKRAIVLVISCVLLGACGDGENRPRPSLGPIARPEHPRPDFRRDTFSNLNVVWDFAYDPDDIGVSEAWFERDDVWTDRVQLPYAWEAPLSGLVPAHEGSYSFAQTLQATTYRGIGWYRLRYPHGLDAEHGKTWYLVFGAVDFDATVWIDGRQAAHHRGGYDPFALDLGAAASEPFEIVVRAEDRTELDDRAQPVGKQGGAWYTRTSGIWQTVYLEQRPPVHLANVRIVPRQADGEIEVTPELSDAVPVTLRLDARLGDQAAGSSEVELSPGASVVLPLDPVESWDASHPRLYDLDIAVRAPGAAEDVVHSYFGLVDVKTDWLPGHAPSDTVEPAEQYRAFFVNGQPTYLSCVLDQSYYPDGIYTAPNLKRIRADLQFAKDLGFNCVRLHIKPDEPVKYRLLDELGFYVVYDIPSLDLQAKNVPGFVGRSYFEETLHRAMERDRNHPSVVAWVVFNENWGLMDTGSILNPSKLVDHPELQQWVRDMVAVARGIDPHRPVEDNSAGGIVQVFEHVDTDLNSFHYYGDDPAALRDFLEQQSLATYPGSSENFVGAGLQDGDPWWNSEIGSFSTFGASAGPKIFCDLFGIENELHRQPKLVGTVLTQLTDVEFELNGLLAYDRTQKPDLCSRDGVELRDVLGSESVAFDWLPGQVLQAGASVDVPLRVRQWSSAGIAERTLRVSWVGAGSAETSLALPISESVPVTVALDTPAEIADGVVVAELLGDQGRTAANRISVHAQ